MDIKRNFNNAITSIKKSYDTVLSSDNKYLGFQEEYNKIFITSQDGISGFTLDITKDEGIKLESDITDYVLENGKMVQSQTTLKPINITITGLVGENVYKAPKKIIGQKFLQSKINKSSGVNILNGLSITAQEYLNKTTNIINKIDNVVSQANNLYDYINNFTKQIKPNQKKAFTELFLLWVNKKLLTVKLPFFDLNNMIIKDVDFKQKGESNMVSEVSISLKQLTFAEIKTIKQRAGINNIQASDKTNKGKTKGKSQALKLTNYFSELL